MANIVPVLINGTNYGFADISLSLMSVPLVSIREINYSETQEMEDFFGAGTRPISRGYGKVTATASITISMDELENIQTIAPGKNIMNIPEFDISVVFIPNSGLIKKHKIRNCKFKNNTREMKQDDKAFFITLELLTSDIEWGEK